MVNFSSLIISSEVTGPGGLFDFDATLPLVAIQFLVLMGILNFLLYNPLLTAIKDRNDFILNNLSTAAITLEKANKITTEYDKELNAVRKEAQLEIINSQKIHKEILDKELNISQKYIDTLLSKLNNEFLTKKENVISSLEKEVDMLSGQIEKKLSL